MAPVQVLIDTETGPAYEPQVRCVFVYYMFVYYTFVYWHVRVPEWARIGRFVRNRCENAGSARVFRVVFFLGGKMWWFSLVFVDLVILIFDGLGS